MIGPGIAPVRSPESRPASKAKHKHATMLGAALAPTTPRSKPPAPLGSQPGARKSQPAAIPEPASSPRAETPHTNKTPSVRAVRDVPVSPAPAAAQAPSPAAQPEPPAALSPPQPAPPEPAVPEVTASVVEPPSAPVAAVPTQPRGYLPGDPMAPQPTAAGRPRAERPTQRIDHAQDEGYDANYVMLYWALCVAVVIAVGALAFRLF